MSGTPSTPDPDFEKELEEAAGQANLEGAVTLEDAAAAHRRLIDIAARVDVGTDGIEALDTWAKFLAQLASST